MLANNLYTTQELFKDGQIVETMQRSMFFRFSGITSYPVG